MDAIFSLLDEYQSYSSKLLDVIEFVIVDDSSPINYEIPNYNLNLTWLRITDNIIWNQSGARNLGVVYAKSDKIFLTDLDFILPEITMAYLVEKSLNWKHAYKIYRIKDSRLSHPPLNIFFLSRSRFFLVHGYDEEFSGNYGYEDVQFYKLLKYYGTRVLKLPKRYFIIDRDIDKERSYHSLTKDRTSARIIYDRKREEVIQYGYGAGHSRMFLNFKWDVLSRQYRPPPARQVDKTWKRTWWFRWVNPFS